MPSIAGAFIAAVVAAVACMSVVFWLAHAKNRYDVIDAVWGVAFVAIAVVTYILGDFAGTDGVSLQLVLLACVTIWGLRLSLHIYRRYRRSQREDRRYTQLRRDYARKKGGVGWNMYLKVYLVQAVLAVVVSTPIIIAMGSAPVPMGVWGWIGGAIWVIGFLFESIGDHQLGAFLRNPANKGKIMTSGLWRYTRHPNYFGEMTQWWGLYIMVWSVPYGWAGLIGPLVITWLLVFISGVPLTERHFRNRPGWDVYRRRTSKLIPLPPRK